MDAAVELGRTLISKHQIQPKYGDKQADAGRDCRTPLARPNSQARTRTRKNHFPCSVDHEQDWQPYPVDPYSCYMCGDKISGHPRRKASVTTSHCVERIGVCVEADSDGVPGSGDKENPTLL